MPQINKFKCDKCNFSFPEGWGGYQYVMDAKGKRVICRHPGEGLTIERVLGKELGPVPFDLAKKNPKKFNLVMKKHLELYRERVGFNSHCICLECLNQFEADFGENVCSVDDKKVVIPCKHCPTCGYLVSLDVSSCDMCGSEFKDLPTEVVMKKIGTESPCVDCGSREVYIYTDDASEKKLVCMDCGLYDEYDDFNFGFPTKRKKPRRRILITDISSVFLEKGRDVRVCPKCGSILVRTLAEMINKKCPKCKKGTIKEISTGWMS